MASGQGFKYTITPSISRRGNSYGNDLFDT